MDKINKKKQTICTECFEIKNRFTNNVIYTSSKTTYKEVCEEAVNYEASLCGADLYEAELCGAELCGAKLCGANLYEANLRETNLRGAELRGAELSSAKFYGKGGTVKLKKNQVEHFLNALGFMVED